MRRIKTWDLESRMADNVFVGGSVNVDGRPVYPDIGPPSVAPNALFHLHHDGRCMATVKANGWSGAVMRDSAGGLALNATSLDARDEVSTLAQFLDVQRNIQVVRVRCMWSQLLKMRAYIRNLLSKADRPVWIEVEPDHAGFLIRILVRQFTRTLVRVPVAHPALAPLEEV